MSLPREEIQRSDFVSSFNLAQLHYIKQYLLETSVDGTPVSRNPFFFFFLNTIKLNSQTCNSGLENGAFGV